MCLDVKRAIQKRGLPPDRRRNAMNYQDPYSPPMNPLSPRETYRLAWRPVAAWAFRYIWRAGVIIAGSICGGIMGYQLLLPPPLPPGEFGCGLTVLPAIMFGFPAGMIVGGLIGLIVVRAIENEARPPSSRSYTLRDGDSNCPGCQPCTLWDRELDG
jgi:hypothetical protein